MLSEKILSRVKDNVLVKKYMNGEFTEKIYFLNAEGGYGKSTSFKSLYYYLVEQGTQANNHIVPIFIDVKRLAEFGEKGSAGNMPRPIEKYIVKNYCGADNDPNESLLEKVVNLFSKNNAPKFQNHYTYFIFVDAINEVNDELKKIILDEIKQMAESDFVKFFISLRVNESSLPDDTVKYKLLPLDEDKIRVYLDKNFGKTGEKVDISKINDSLMDILRVPMYLSVFRETYDEKTPYPDIYEAKAVRKTDILDSFIQKLLDDNKGKERSADKAVIEFVVKYFLPALAFLMANTNGFIIDSDSTEKLNYDYFKKFFKGTKKEVIKNLMNSEAYNPLSICCKTFSILIENGDNFSFTHQNWRDLFLAKHIINCMNAEKLDDLEISIDANIREFVGELIREYKPGCGYSKDYMDKSDAEKTRKSECDFEDKDNLETWHASPVEDFLQKHNLKSQNPLSAMATKNLIEIMKTSRNGKITSDFENLNLLEVSFESTNVASSDFRGSSMGILTFKPHNCIFSVYSNSYQRHDKYHYYSNKVSISSSGRFYACAYNYNVVVFETNTGNEYARTNLLCEFTKIKLNIQDIISQISFFNDHIIIIGYPYCIVFYDFEKNEINEKNIFYHTNSSIISFENFYYENSSLNFIPLEDIQTSNSKALSFFEKITSLLDKKSIKKIENYFWEIDKGKHIKISQMLLNEIEKVLESQLDNFQMNYLSNRLLNLNTLFLLVQGDCELENFSVDFENGYLYILFNNEIFYCNIKHYPDIKWIKLISFEDFDYPYIVSLDGYGVLVLKRFFDITNFTVLFIDHNGDYRSCNLTKRINEYVKYLNKNLIFAGPQINRISLKIDEPVLKIEVHFGFSRCKNSNWVFFYNVISDKIEDMSKDFSIKNYFVIDCAWPTNMLGLPIESELLGYEKNCKYCIVSNVKKLDNMQRANFINMMKLPDLTYHKTLFQYPCYSEVNATVIENNYVAIYISGYLQSWIYDIKQKKLYYLKNNEIGIELNIDESNTLLLPNLNFNLTLKPSDYSKYSDMCNNISSKNNLQTKSVVAKAKNICAYLINNDVTSIDLNDNNSGGLTYFYHNGLHVNLVQKNKSGATTISLKSFEEKNSYVYNKYLVLYFEKEEAIQIINLNLGTLATSTRKYEIKDMLTENELQEISRNNFINFAKYSKMKIHVSDKCYICINGRIIVLDKSSQDFISIPERGSYYAYWKENIRDFIIKENILFGLNKENNLTIIYFDRDNPFIKIRDDKEYICINDCPGNLFLTVDVNNILSIWNYSEKSKDKITELNPFYSISLDYLTSFNVENAIFDDGIFNETQREELKSMGAIFFSDDLHEHY